jgi:hypothetical protein
LPEWLVERGIGERRYALVEKGEIAEVRVLLDGAIAAGTALRARLKQIGPPTIAELGDFEFLLPKGAPGLTEGMVMTIEVSREAIPGVEPWKRQLAHVVEGDCRNPELPEGETLPFPSPDDRLGQAGWWDLIEEARSGIVAFEGGELRVLVTPAMTLIDVDGILPPLDLAISGAQAAAGAIRRHGIGGSIGIDLPTIGGKLDRQAVGDAIDAVLPKPFERTAMNGFGFLQIVRPRRHASLFELAQDRAAFEARALLRRTAFEGPGPRRLAAHPAVLAVLQQHTEWLDRLAEQIGGAVSLRADVALPMSGGYAEKA